MFVFAVKIFRFSCELLRAFEVEFKIFCGFLSGRFLSHLSMISANILSSQYFHRSLKMALNQQRNGFCINFSFSCPSPLRASSAFAYKREENKQMIKNNYT
jgi:hypothetical protein